MKIPWYWINGLTFLFLTFFLSRPLQGQALSQPGKQGEVVVKSFPAYPAAETEINGAVSSDWQNGFRKCTRYIHSTGGEIHGPIVVQYPEWENHPPAPQARMRVHLMMSPEGKFIEPKETGIGVVEIPAMSVASYAYRGASTLENFQKALAEIQTYLEAHHLSALGAPRQVFHSNFDWTPSWLQVSEVQVPIRLVAPPL